MCKDLKEEKELIEKNKKILELSLSIKNENVIFAESDKGKKLLFPIFIHGVLIDFIYFSLIEKSKNEKIKYFTETLRLKNFYSEIFEFNEKRIKTKNHPLLNYKLEEIYQKLIQKHDFIKQNNLLIEFILKNDILNEVIKRMNSKKDLFLEILNLKNEDFKVFKDFEKIEDGFDLLYNLSLKVMKDNFHCGDCVRFPASCDLCQIENWFSFDSITWESTQNGEEVFDFYYENYTK